MAEHYSIKQHALYASVETFSFNRGVKRRFEHDADTFLPGPEALLGREQAGMKDGRLDPPARVCQVVRSSKVSSELGIEIIRHSLKVDEKIY